MDTLEQLAVINFLCASRNITDGDQQVLRYYWRLPTCVYFYKLKVYTWNQRFKYGITDILSTLILIQPGSWTIALGFISLYNVDTAWTEIFGTLCSTICHKRHYTKVWQIWHEGVFYKRVSWHKSAWNWKMFTLKKNAFQLWRHLTKMCFTCNIANFLNTFIQIIINCIVSQAFSYMCIATTLFLILLLVTH